MSPDILSGSKTMKKQIYGIVYQLAAANPWFNPQLNPRGHWQFTVDTFKSFGMMNVEEYMPAKPPVPYGDVSLVEKLWSEFSHGEQPEIDPQQNHMQILAALAKKIESDLMKLDEEYRPNVQAYMIKLQVSAMEQMKKAQEQQIVNAMAAQTIQRINNGQVDTSGQGQAKIFQPPADATVAQPTGVESIAGPVAGSPVAQRKYLNTPASGAE